MKPSIAAIVNQRLSAKPAKSARPFRKKRTAITPPKELDAVELGTCLRCGYRGPHPTPADCIAALRERLSRYE